MTKNLLILAIIFFAVGGSGFLFQEASLVLAQSMNPFTQLPPQQPPIPQQQIPQQPPIPQQQIPQQPPIPQQQIPQQQQSPPQTQSQQGQPLYNPNQVVACLNHVLVDSIVKAGTTPDLTLHNNTKGAAPALNQTFIQNATQTLDSCIIPINK
jgi:hypothetical protein